MGRGRARATRRSRTSTRCRGCTRCSRGTASGRPTSSRIRSRPIRARPRCCAGCWRGGDCEIGAHHHAWETPPCTADDVARHPYASTLPRAQFEDQLAVADRRDRPRPSARGRCRIAPAASGSRPITSPALERLGYLVESSVAPLFYEAHKGGPEFVEAPLTPYFLAYDSATRPGTSNLLEVPVSRGAEPPAAEAAAVSPTRARRGRTRPSACCGARRRCACAGCGRRIRRSTT